ncbi:MAG: hypothetical protein WCX31_05345 [Salinivirgaceae bacterium]
MKTHYLLILVIFSQVSISCDQEQCRDCDPNPCTTTINENIVPLAVEDYYGRTNIPTAVWLNDSIIFNPHPLQFRVIDKKFNVIKNSMISMYEGAYFIESSPSQNKIIYVQTRFGDVSEGALREYDTETGRITEFFDSTCNISSAVYYRNNDSIIYYTYGKPFYNNPGYFLYKRSTGESTLILDYLAQLELPETEMVNGFDIHPTKNILLIPAVRRSKSPLIIQYNMETKVMDTLAITFDLSNNRICLWLRYNKAGDKILYSCYPEHAGTSSTSDVSEVGVIDLNTMQKKILDVNTSEWCWSVNVFPNWSPDEKNIVYGSGRLTDVGARGLYHLYILKNVN